jgi:hypothetical protein
MKKYRAIVSIEFTESDIDEVAEQIGVDSLDPIDFVNGELDNMFFGGWVEQVFEDEQPLIHRLTNGMMVEVNNYE